MSKSYSRLVLEQDRVHCGLVFKQCWIRKSILHLLFVLTFTRGERSRVPGAALQTGQLSLNVWRSFVLMFFSKVRHLLVVEGFSLYKIKAYLLKGKVDTERYEAKVASVFVY